MIVLVMGVAGVGKTTIGEALARALGWRFVDADDYHPPQNVAKMAAGVPLEDADRWPWLERINKKLLELEASGESVIVACSALKEAYRRYLLQGIDRYEIVYLHGSSDLISSRIVQRYHRFMPAALLESQFAALEPPTHAIAVDVAADPSSCVAAIMTRLKK